MQKLQLAQRNQNLSTPGNVAIGDNGEIIGTQKKISKIGSVQELCIHLIAGPESGDGAYAGGVIKIITGAGDVSSTPATGITFGTASSFSSFAALQDYFKSNKMVVSAIRATTTDTTNFESSTLTLGFRNPNNRNNREEDINLVDFAKSQGDGLQKNLIINDLEKAFLPSNYMNINTMKNSTELKLYLRIYEMEQAGDYTSIVF